MAARPAVAPAVARHSAGLLAGLGACSLGCSMAQAQQYPTTATTLPNTGLSLNVGNLRATLPRSFEAAGPVTTTPAWTFTTALDVQEEFTDNLFYTATDHRSDLVTIVTPSLSIAGDTRRLQVNLTYAPTVSYYARNTSQNQIGQTFGGTALATIVPGTLFLDLRASGGLQSVAGARSLSGGGPALTQQNEVQTLDFSASPYLQHRFGGWGTAEIGYSYSRTSLSSNGTTPTVSLFGPPVAADLNTDLNTQSAHASFITGENLGRTQSSFLATSTRYDDKQGLSGTNTTVIDEVAFGLTHRVALLARIGYEDISYDTQPAVRINDAVWGFGVRLTPNPDSTITVRYGHQDGLNSLYVDAAYAPTPHTEIFVRYSEGLTSTLQDLQTAIGSAAFDPYGNPVDQRTGAPILPIDNFFGIQNGLFRERRFSLTGTYTLPRDTVSASINAERQTLLANSTSANAFGAGPSDGVYGVLNWGHSLSESLQSGLSLEYGTNTVSSALVSGAAVSAAPGGNTNLRLISATASLHYLVTETLSARVEYDFSKVMFDQPGGDITANTVFVGFHKQF